jgi:glycosyltransferase involved in cell wall biosynthesis
MTTMFDRSAPLITIILLCYNQHKFVAEAVNGVLAQTYSPLEILIFDDCSTDQTAQIIERTLAEHPPRSDVRFIRNPRNMHSNLVVRMALGMAKGAFIFVSHGDDVMLPEMVAEMANVWIKEGVSLVAANAYYIDENSEPLHRTYRDPDQPADDSFEALARDGSNACCFGPAIGFERAIPEKFGWVPRELGAYDIMYPFYAYLLKGARFINKPLLKYRVHGQNTSLSLRVERSDGVDRLKAEHRIYIGHILHAVLMEQELDKLLAEAPERYAPVSARIKPLLAIQRAEMANKLLGVSRQLAALAPATPR